MKSAMERRLDKLESDIRRVRSAHSDPITMAALDLLTDDELAEMRNLFNPHESQYWDEMPVDVQNRAMAILDSARARAGERETERY